MLIAGHVAHSARALPTGLIAVVLIAVVVGLILMSTRRKRG
jgi:uncharacterized membrane-anchored protein